MSSALDAAVHGTDFGEALGGALRNVAVNNALAATQFGIGNLGLGEGSVEHALLHGLAGCAFAEVSGGDCAAGLASGIAQSVYAGYVDRNGLDKAAAVETAALIGAGVRFLFSSGEGQNVSIGNTTAQSGFVNNYLSHGESMAFQEAMGQCEETDTECIDRVNEAFATLSVDNNEAFENCADDVCRAYHIARMQSADLSGAFKVAMALSEEKTSAADAENGWLISLDLTHRVFGVFAITQNTYDDDARKQFLREEVSTNICGGPISSCDFETRVALAGGQLLTMDEMQVVIEEQAVEVARQQEIAREDMRGDICGDTRGASCEAMVDAEIESQRKNWNRVGGAVNAAFGLVEIGGATYICGQSVGTACVLSAAVAVHGADTYVAGMQQLITGESTTTLGAALLMNSLGLNETAATLLYDGLSLTGELKAAKMLLAQRAVAESLTMSGFKFVDETLEFTPPPELVTIYRGTNNANEIRIFEESGAVLSDAARAAYMEARYAGESIDAALASAIRVSDAAHSQQLSVWWDNIDDYVQAHGAFGTEISVFGARSLISFTTDPNIAARFGDEIFEFQVPKTSIIPQTLTGAGEAEVLILNGIP